MLKEKTLDLLNGEEKNFENIFSICIGNLFNIQQRFIDYIGQQYSNWSTDIRECTLKLGNERVFDVEYIGTTSQSDNFWFSSEVEKLIPDAGTQLMTNARKNLERYGFTDLAQPKIELIGDINGYNLSMIYMAFIDAKTAYFCGLGNTNIYMFVKNLDEKLFDRINSVEFSNRIMKLISTFNVNHRLMVKAILTENDIEYTEEDNEILAKFNDTSITITFENGRIKNCLGNLSL